ncbi:hypothetical protein FB107DRAFT_273910 [Schizophyllum commune]
MLKKTGPDRWTSKGAVTPFACVCSSPPPPVSRSSWRLSDSCGFGWRFAHVSYENRSESRSKYSLKVALDPYLIADAPLGNVKVIARSTHTATELGSIVVGEVLLPHSQALFKVLDDADQRLETRMTIIGKFSYKELEQLQQAVITITVSFESPHIHLPVETQKRSPPSVKSVRKALCDAISGTEINDVEFVLPVWKNGSQIAGYDAVYGNREVLRGVSTYLDTLLFDDHFSEGTTCRFGDFNAIPDTPLELDYADDSDIDEYAQDDDEEEDEDERLEDTGEGVEEHDVSDEGGAVDAPAATNDEETAAERVREQEVLTIEAEGDASSTLREDSPDGHESLNEEGSGWQRGRVIHLDGFGYRTWKALLVYLYTGELDFCQLRSLYTAEDYPALPHACSSKSMYRIAHMLEMQDLQALCLDDLESQLCAANIVEEAFSVFTSRYPKVREIEIAVLKKHYKECADERKAMMRRVAKGEVPHCEEVLNAMMDFVP